MTDQEATDRVFEGLFLLGGGELTVGFLREAAALAVEKYGPDEAVMQVGEIFQGGTE